MQRPSDQIGGKELRNRVAVAIHAELIDRLQDGNLEDWPTVAAMRRRFVTALTTTAATPSTFAV